MPDPSQEAGSSVAEYGLSAWPLTVAAVCKGLAIRPPDNKVTSQRDRSLGPLNMSHRRKSARPTNKLRRTADASSVSSDSDADQGKVSHNGLFVFVLSCFLLCDVIQFSNPRLQKSPLSSPRWNSTPNPFPSRVSCCNTCVWPCDLVTLDWPVVHVPTNVLTRTHKVNSIFSFPSPSKPKKNIKYYWFYRILLSFSMKWWDYTVASHTHFSVTVHIWLLSKKRVFLSCEKNLAMLSVNDLYAPLSRLSVLNTYTRKTKVSIKLKRPLQRDKKSDRGRKTRFYLLNVVFTFSLQTLSCPKVCFQ